MPGEVHSDLLRNSLIQDLHKGQNELNYKWIGLSDWKFSKKFDTTVEMSMGECELQFDGIDTISKIYLNGNLLGSTNNMFLQYIFQINKLLRPVGEENELVVEIFSPHEYLQQKKKKYAFEIPLWEYPNGVFNRNFIR